MKKKATLLLVTAALATQVGQAAAAGNVTATNSPGMKLSIDGTLHTSIPVKNGRSFAPIRTIATDVSLQDSKLEIAWNQGQRVASVKVNGKQIAFQAGSLYASVDDKDVQLDAAPYVSAEGVLYVPVTSLQSVFGKNVNWSKENVTIEVTTSMAGKAVAVLESLENGDPEALIQFVDPGYIQHNLTLPTGRDVIVSALPQLKAAGTSVTPRRVLVDGNLVAVHSEYNFGGPKAGFDIFRFDNGKIVEHWDNLQFLAQANPSGHTMLDGQNQISDLEKTEANKTLVKSFVEDILMGKHPDRLTSYFDGDNYIQHNPSIADGLTGLGAALKAMEEQGIDMKYDQIHQVIGQGNFVLLVSEGTFAGNHTSYYDMFRVEKGKIAEHWDVLETIFPADQQANSNGKF